MIPNNNWNNIPASSWNYREEIQTFQDACRKLGVDASDPMYYQGTKDEIAYKKLKVVIQALNDGWLADFNQREQWKYYPWFRVSDNAGLKLATVCPQNAAVMVSGDWLCSKSKEIATYAAEQFSGLYLDFLSRQR